jgi:hypothetical protein
VVWQLEYGHMLQPSHTFSAGQPSQSPQPFMSVSVVILSYFNKDDCLGTEALP